MHAARYSRRDVLLIAISVMWLSRGASILLSDSPGTHFTNVGETLTGFLTSGWSAVPWLLCGATALLAAHSNRQRNEATLQPS